MSTVTAAETAKTATGAAPSVAGVAADKQIAPAPRPRLEAGASVGAIIPRSIEEVQRLAKWIAAAGWAPKGYRTDGKDGPFSEEKIAVGILHGLEVGFTPIAALQSIAVINGMPSVFGDGALALVQNSGLMADFREEPMHKDNKLVGYRCTAVRKGTPTAFVHTFTLEDAAKAKLIGKQGPWTDYPGRMLQMRARAWTLRAGFADVLRGLHIVEEARDITDAVIIADAPRAHASADSALDAFAGAPDPAASAAGEAVTGDGTGEKPTEITSPETGEIKKIPQPPVEAVEAFENDGKWGPMWKWFCETMENTRDQDMRGNLAFIHAELLSAVFKHNEKYALAVRDSMTRWGVPNAIPKA